MRSKITVIGEGEFGGAVAQTLSEREYAEIVHLESLDGAAADDLSGSRVVVVTQGGEQAGAQIAQRAPDAVVVVAALPAGEVCRSMLEATCFPRQRIVGAAGLIPSGRLRKALARELDVSVRDVSALVLGGDGDAGVPVASSLAVAGIPVTQRLSEAQIAHAVSRAREGQEQITVSIAAQAVAEVVDSIVFDRKRVMPCTVRCLGELGIEDGFATVPVKLGADGVEQILELPLTDDERAALARSAV